MEEHNMEQADFESLLRDNRAYQSAFDRKVDKALQTARTNWEREREEGLETERARLRSEELERLEGQRRELERREADYQLRMRQLSVADRLVGLGLSPKFAPWLTGEDEAASFQRVDQFDAAFRQAVDQAVAAGISGFPPLEPVSAPAFDRDSLRGMSPREVNAHWAEIQQTLKG